jgi:competence CoiA-like predicted nuclease
MPFVARHAVTHARIDITQIANPRQVLQAEEVICQLCEEHMIVRQGMIIRPHFAHKRACALPYEAHPESPEHLLGKEYMSLWLRQQPEFLGARIDLEVPIHQRKRIADILVTFPTGQKVAVEIQLALMTTEALMARTKDYLDDGIDVVWVFGGNALRSQSNLDWCKRTLGEYLHLQFVDPAPLATITLGGDDPSAATAPGVAAGANGRRW